MADILWIDDEVDFLRPHILFLESKGHSVASVTNGADGIAKVREKRPDLVFLDEQMPGMGGLDVLAEIAQFAPEVPVVMVTKSEEEHLMEEALGAKITDYLTKPVNPSQILLTLKRVLDRKRLAGEKAQQDYLQQFGALSQRLGGRLSHAEWVDLYLDLVRFDTGLDAEEGVRQVLDDQHRDANRQFARFVEEEYAQWIAADGPGDERPILSHEVLGTHVVPHLRDAKKVIFMVVDCMRYDQWLEMEKLLYPLFDIRKDFHYGLLPTATPYARNALFSGLLPRDIARRYPRLWNDDEGEHSMNQHEETFLNDYLERKHFKNLRVRYDKVVSSKDGRDFAAGATDLVQHDLAAVVVNFVDILAHSRSDSPVLKEIAPDERAYRALTGTWFEHSWLLQAFQTLARQDDITLVITTDHGAIRCLHATKVIGDRETSTALRYKHGRQLRADDKHAIFVRDPESYGLPRLSLNENYILAKEDYYFVYPTNYHHYLNLYRDTMQHGGVSMEEMILPILTLTPKR